MSSGTARLLFVIILVINCVIWSQSRYGVPHEASLYRGEEYGSLRTLLLATHNIHGAYFANLKPAEKKCHPLQIPLDSQCRHVEAACPAPATFLSIHYLKHYFCQTPALRPAAFVALLLWLIFLFSTLGISASDFFTPNLATIAQLLGLEENVAGVTFLAFGNGSPDVFSTFSAMRANSGSLAIGELLGAASFIVSCVVGSMCIIKPFRVHKRPFIRDVGFFTAASVLLLVVLWDSEIQGWEAGLLIVLYVVYVAVVVIGSWWERKQEARRTHEAQIRAEYQDDESSPMPTSPYRDDPQPLGSPQPHLSIPQLSPPATRVRAISHPEPPRLETALPRRPHSRTPSPSPSSHMAYLPSFSLVGALEFRQVVASLQHQAAGTRLNVFDSPITPFAGGHYHGRNISLSRSQSLHQSMQPEVDPWDTALGVPLGERPNPRLAITPAYTDEPAEIGSPRDVDVDSIGEPVSRPDDSVPSISVSGTPASPSDSTDERTLRPPTKRERFMHAVQRTVYILFPSLHHFRGKSVPGQIASVFAAPAVLLLTLTLPVVVTEYLGPQSAPEKDTPGREGRLIDFEEEGMERILIAEEEVQEDLHDLSYNKWLFAAQCLFGPLFCIGVLFSGTKHQNMLLLAAAIAGIALATLVIIFSGKRAHPSLQTARCFMGFMVAIVWIMAIADEVVQVLQAFGFIFGLSDAIIGLTIFAVGNSLADLVANMSVAVFAPIMGFSACFGGPMLNILLGVGVSGSYVIGQTGVPYPLHFSTTLLVSTVGLLTLLCATMVYVPWNNYFLSRSWGIFLVVSYFVIMGLNVFVELKS